MSFRTNNDCCHSATRLKVKHLLGLPPALKDRATAKAAVVKLASSLVNSSPSGSSLTNLSRAES